MRWVRLKWLLPQMPSTLPCVVFAFFFFFFFRISFSFVFVYLFLPMPLWVLTPILCCPRIFCSLDFSPHSPRLFFLPALFSLWFADELRMNWTSGCLHPVLFFSFSCTLSNGEFGTILELPHPSCTLSSPLFPPPWSSVFQVV